MKIESVQDKIDHVVKLMFARSYLYLNGCLTESANQKVFFKIKKYVEKNKLEIKAEQFDRANIILERVNS